MIVMKFGGTSVGSGERMVQVARIVLAEYPAAMATEQSQLATSSESPPANGLLVVTSALAGVTDMLLALAETTLRGEMAEVDARLAAIVRRHQEAARQIFPAEAALFALDATPSWHRATQRPDDPMLSAGTAAESADHDPAAATASALGWCHDAGNEAPATDGAELATTLMAGYQILQRQVRAVRGDASQAARHRDALAAWGERLAVVLLAAAVRRIASTAATPPPAIAMTRWPLIVTDDHFGEATPAWDMTQSVARARWHGGILVAPGFLGQAAPGYPAAPGTEQAADGQRTGSHGNEIHGLVADFRPAALRHEASGDRRLAPDLTTLGRGGSDYSATILAGALRATACWIYTDVDGIFTADPRVVPAAEVLPVVTAPVAGRLALCGAKVLHPRSVAPAARHGVELRVRNTFQPAHPGTLIVAVDPVTEGLPVAVAGRKKLVVLTLAGDGIAEIPNCFGRMCAAIAAAGPASDGGIDIILASHPVPGQTPEVVVDAALAAAASARIAREFADELTRGQISAVTHRDHQALCALVGENLSAATLLQAQRALADEHIRPLSQSANPDALIFIIAEAALDRAVRAIHAAVIVPARLHSARGPARPYPDGQWAAGGRPQQRRRMSSPQH